MAPDKKGDTSNRIPINFLDSDESTSGATANELELSNLSPEGMTNDMAAENETDVPSDEGFDGNGSPEPLAQADGSPAEVAPLAGGPEVAELVATRAELKRLEGEVKELRDSLARRQADLENYRKRMERERSETYNRVVADIAAKLLPVLDNLKRALETEASIEASESDEFRHFLSGVDLIYKQLNGVLDALGVKPVLAEGEQFNPHLHEAVVTEPTDDFEPDTVIQEIVRGFKLGDKLIRPALVKVAVKK
ncbi:MAG TPA: nucleotide exchange factor GrpE [Pyrinomonadaceae bacterium]|jgi:molecular chaperone GrpE|nr:nucleotide exchange factor GrpE [Pyrinomonadaceae bacterium]